MVIGEDMQRRCTQYYIKEYYLSLEKVAKHMGHTLQSYDAPSRLLAQAAVLAGMAQGITDISEPEEVIEVTAIESSDDGLGDLEDHLF
jgi:hypothetical protein